MKDGKRDEADAAKEQVRLVNERINGLEAHLEAAEADARYLLMTAPNPPDASAPVGVDEGDNVEVKRWGTPPEFDFEPAAHWDLGPALGILDFERAVKLAESRFVLLGGMGAKLNRALINFMLDTHAEAGYRGVGAAGARQRRDADGHGPAAEVRGRPLQDHRRPLPDSDGRGACSPTSIATRCSRARRCRVNYTAYTPCFREEAGSAGRDTRGMIRVHQFDKVELVKFTRPEESFDALEGMLADAERILQKLGLAYRVIVLCTGDMGFGAAKTYDIEVWLPSYGAYKEISSCSNCVDFQARRAAIKYRSAGEFKGSRLVHTLNGSGLAVGRTLAAVLENYQLADGSVEVPEVLQAVPGRRRAHHRRGA